MNKNMGSADRFIRFLAGPILIIVALLAIESTALKIVLAAFGLIMVLTSSIGLCPGYIPFGLNTRKAEEKKP